MMGFHGRVVCLAEKQEDGAILALTVRGSLTL